jgi:DNA-binding PadR family transcriptional regulator
MYNQLLSITGVVMSPMISRPLTIELALLGYLQGGPLHGYQIHQLLQEPGGLGQIWRIKQPQLYALLGKLEEAGLIQGAIQAQEARPARRVYDLTPAGKETYKKWLIAPVNTPRQMRQEFLGKYYFALLDSPQTVIALIEAQLSVCQRWLEWHQEQLSADPRASFSRDVSQYRFGQIQTTLTWLQQLKTDASKITLPIEMEG